MAMEVTLHLMDAEEKPLLARMMELYLYEFTQFSGDDISEHGFYGYDHIDDYWNESGRFPYLIRADGKIAGFALVCPHCDFRTEKDARCVGEFFVMLKYRRMGVGFDAATALFERHPGKWEVCWWKSNVPAEKFWKKVVDRYTRGDCHPCGDEASHQQGLVFDNHAGQSLKNRG